MNWDYDKLFAEGNIVGVKNTYENKVYHWIVDNANEEGNSFMEEYRNPKLTYKANHVVGNCPECYATDFVIMWIIRLAEDGEIAEYVFDRQRDMKETNKQIEDDEDEDECCCCCDDCCCEEESPVINYCLRFFVDEQLIARYDSTTPPVIPHKHEIVNFNDNNWEPYEVVSVEYNYPDNEIGSNLFMIDVDVEEVCE